MISNMKQFIQACIERPDEIYEIFEDESTDELRGQVYNFCTAGSPEPFRSAMHNLGFTDY